jgi:RimJ/RimL family protein N-acetyltransferase
MAAPRWTGTDKQGHPYELRALVSDDRRALQAMYESFEPKRGAQGLPPAGPEQIARWLETVLAGGYHLIVEAAGGVVGHGMILPYSSQAAELANFLHQSMRDRGIGTALNRALLDVARNQGITTVWLSVEPSNRRAIRSYENAGFRRRPASVWSPEIEMEATL